VSAHPEGGHTVVRIRFNSVFPQRPDDVAGEDVVRVAVPDVGTLVNPVEVVGTTRPRLPEEARR